MGGIQSVCMTDRTVQDGQLPQQPNIVQTADTPYQKQIRRSKIKPTQSRIADQTPKQSLLPPNQYIDSLNLKQNLKRQLYRKFTQFEITNQLNHRQIQIDRTAKILNHKKVAVDMQNFLKHDWQAVEKIDFTKSLIDDAKWRLFVEKAHLFPNLQILRLDENNITQVKSGDLDGFASLRNVSFGDYDSIANPLTRQSKRYLLKFEKSQTSPKFWLEYVPQ